MPSKKKTKPDLEIVEDDAGLDARPVNAPARKVVETKTITYEEPVSETDDEDMEEGFIIEDKPSYRKAAKSERTKAKERWQKKRGVTGGLYRIRIDRLPMFDVNGQTGVNAERKFVKMISSCTGKYVDDEEYLEVIRGMIQTGQTQPGAFWVQILDSQGIVDQWAEFLDGGMPATIQAQPIAVPDPANPGQVIVQMPQQSQIQTDPFAEFDKTLKMFERMEKMRQSLGVVPAQQQNPAPMQSPEISVAELLMKDPHHAKKIVGNLMGGEGEKDLMALAFEHGPALIESLGNVIRNIISDVKGGSNGTAAMAQTALQNQNLPMENGQQNRHLSSFQMGQEGADSFQQGEGGGLESTEQYQMPQSVRPEDELFSRVLDFCKRRTPPDIAAGEIAALANTVEENPAAMVPGYGLIRQYPIGSSIWPFIEMFCETPIDQALAYVAGTSENGAEIVKLSHAEAWATQLQVELKKAYEPGGEIGNQS